MQEVIDIQTLYKKFHKDNASKRNPMTLPRLRSVVLSVGCGKFHKDQAMLDFMYAELEKIAAQKPVFAKAKQSISNFGIREGAIVGLFVTLRSHQMFNFLNRFILIAMPRMQIYSLCLRSRLTLGTIIISASPSRIYFLR